MKIGIVTISFNQARFLRETIESVRINSPHELCYVIVDPGSADGSREIIQQCAHRFHQIIFESDKGPADGLNKGFQHCDAEIYGYINSDDRFAPGALDYVADFFTTHPQVDVLLGACLIIDDLGRSNLRKRLSSNYSIARVLNGTANALQQATFFRQRAWRQVNGFNIENRTCWDGELLVDMALAGAVFQTVWKVLGHFRIYSESISGSGRMNDAYRKDVERIIAKARASSALNCSPSTAHLYQLARRLNPVRRIMEFIVK